MQRIDLVNEFSKRGYTTFTKGDAGSEMLFLQDKITHKIVQTVPYPQDLNKTTAIYKSWLAEIDSKNKPQPEMSK